MWYIKFLYHTILSYSCNMGTNGLLIRTPEAWGAHSTSQNFTSYYISRQEFEVFHNWIESSGILAYGTFEINHGQPWFISNVRTIGKNETN